VRELWQRTEQMQLKPGESYSSCGATSRAASTRRPGRGVRRALHRRLTTLRDHAGSGRAPLEPVDVTKQRAALDLIATEIFSADSFNFSPSFLRKMTVSVFDIDDAEELGPSGAAARLPRRPAAPPDAAQRARCADEPGDRAAPAQQRAKTDDPKRALKVADLYGTLHAAVWSELARDATSRCSAATCSASTSLRIANALLQPSAMMPADARATLRADAQALRAELAAAQNAAG
jgi:hypothetical protein